MNKISDMNVIEKVVRVNVTYVETTQYVRVTLVSVLFSYRV